jgi:hypothetical protein
VKPNPFNEVIGMKVSHEFMLNAIWWYLSAHADKYDQERINRPINITKGRDGWHIVMMK